MHQPGNLDEWLHTRMQQAGIVSFRQLAKQANVSFWQVQQLRRGKMAQMRLENVLKLSQALKLHLTELIAFNHMDAMLNSGMQGAGLSELELLRQEYKHLQVQLEDQQHSLQLEFQRSSLHTLESWLKNWPHVIDAVKHKKPDLLVSQILPLLSPVESLLTQWGVEAIGEIDQVCPYNPHWHHLIEGNTQPGEAVRVTRPGYRHNNSILHRAEVTLEGYNQQQ